MIAILSDTIEGDKRIIVYTVDGVTESHRVSMPAYGPTPEEALPIPKSPYEELQDRVLVLEELELERMMGGMGL